MCVVWLDSQKEINIFLWSSHIAHMTYVKPNYWVLNQVTESTYHRHKRNITSKIFMDFHVEMSFECNACSFSFKRKFSLIHEIHILFIIHMRVSLSHLRLHHRSVNWEISLNFIIVCSCLIIYTYISFRYEYDCY